MFLPQLGTSSQYYYHSWAPGANVVLLARPFGGAGGVLFALKGEGEDTGAALARAPTHHTRFT